MHSSNEEGKASRSRATEIGLRALDVLLFKNPERTALGVMLGFSLYGVLNFFSPALSFHHFQVGNVDWWSCLAVGLVTVHSPFLFWSVRHKPLVNDEVEGLITLIERTNIGEAEKRQAYRRVVNKCIDEFSINGQGRTLDSVIAEANEAARGKLRNNVVARAPE